MCCVFLSSKGVSRCTIQVLLMLMFKSKLNVTRACIISVEVLLKN